MSGRDLWSDTQRLRGYGVSPEAMERSGLGLYGYFGEADIATKAHLGQQAQLAIDQEKHMAAYLASIRNGGTVGAGTPNYEASWNFAWVGTLAKWVVKSTLFLAALVLLVAYVVGPIAESRARSLSGLDQWTVNDTARYLPLDRKNFNRPLEAKIAAAQPYLIATESGERWKDAPQMRASVAALFAAQIEGYRPNISPGSVQTINRRMLEYQLDLNKRTGQTFTFNDTLPLLLANSGGVERYGYLRDVTINLAERAPKDPVAQARAAQVNAPEWATAEKWHLVGRIGIGVRMALGMLKESMIPSQPTG